MLEPKEKIGSEARNIPTGQVRPLPIGPEAKLRALASQEHLEGNPRTKRRRIRRRPKKRGSGHQIRERCRVNSINQA